MRVNASLVQFLCINKRFERRRSRVVRAAWIWHRKSPEGREFKARLCHPTTGPEVIKLFRAQLS